MTVTPTSDDADRGRRRDRVPRGPRPDRADRANRAIRPDLPRALPTRGTAALAPEPDLARATTGQRGIAPWLRVAPPPPVSVPRAPFVALVLVVVIGGVLGILMVNTKINENAIQLSQLRQEQIALNQTQRELDQQIATYSSPNSLAAQARKLGLVPAKPAFLQLPDGRIIRVPQPAGGAPSITSGLQPIGR